ncbi:hypothetical protein CLV30_103137 [Haloactinopolyspora alba]|uniref:Uncharacterized protein n=1 Tax=Haloactinopolyspora alba TaxID=648780 RepID=A0A2P8E936_9ACTN|nr:hypothetical protein [Haloactinopolyspora alba]PSL05983.1 hypothetical protein CLV30_103137 [Haloactinopolyspora alba]
MTDNDTGPAPARGRRSAVVLARVAIAVAGVASTARRAKDSSDLLDHADLIAQLTALTVVGARWLKPPRTSLPDPG